MDSKTFSKLLKALKPLITDPRRTHLDGAMLRDRRLMVTNGHYLVEVMWESGDEYAPTFIPRDHFGEVVEKLKRHTVEGALEGLDEGNFPPVDKVRAERCATEGVGAIGVSADYVGKLMKAVTAVGKADGKADGKEAPGVRWQIPNNALEAIRLDWEGRTVTFAATLMPCRLK